MGADNHPTVVPTNYDPDTEFQDRLEKELASTKLFKPIPDDIIEELKKLKRQ